MDAIRTKKEWLNPQQRGVFEEIPVGKCKTVSINGVPVEVCRVDEDTFDAKIGRLGADIRRGPQKG